MPHQVFSDRNGDEIVLVRWDFAMTVVEVVLRGAPLARIGDLGRLRSEFGIYGTDTGRMCVAALNSRNIQHVCASIAKVV